MIATLSENNVGVKKGINRFVYGFLVFNIIIDVFAGSFGAGGPTAILRAFVNYMFILSFLYTELKLTRYNIILYVFVIYILALVPFSSDLYLSLKVSLMTLNSILLFPVGYYLIRNYSQLRKLNNSVIILMIVLALNFIISNMIGYGKSHYSDKASLINGNLHDSWNLFTYSLLLVPLVLHFSFKKKQKILTVILAIFLSIILLLSLKRIAIFVMFLGYPLLFYFLGFGRRIMVPFIGLILALGLTFPFYKDILYQRIDARAERLSTDSYESEARYEESFYVWDYILSFEDPANSLFGVEVFNSSGKYADGKFKDRQLHIDYNNILFTTGIVGLLLYFGIFSGIYYLYRKYSRGVRKTADFKILRATFLTLFLMQFVTSLAGEMYSVTFRSIIFLYLGALIGVIRTLRLGQIMEKKANESVGNLQG